VRSFCFAGRASSLVTLVRRRPRGPLAGSSRPAASQLDSHVSRGALRHSGLGCCEVSHNAINATFVSSCAEVPYFALSTPTSRRLRTGCVTIAERGTVCMCDETHVFAETHSNPDPRSCAMSGCDRTYTVSRVSITQRFHVRAILRAPFPLQACHSCQPQVTLITKRAPHGLISQREHCRAFNVPLWGSGNGCLVLLIAMRPRGQSVYQESVIFA